MVRLAYPDQKVRQRGRGVAGMIPFRGRPRYDEVLGSVPKYRYSELGDRLCRFHHSAATSPLPGSQLMRRK
ncbi:hypothetical protein OKW43_000709 [Paraburkholderia sp. WC7.3g]